MDKLKVFFAQFKKHHFWVLTGLALLLSLAVWYVATGELEAQTIAFTAKVKDQFRTLHSIVAKTEHPNEKFATGTKLLETNLRKDVDKAWSLVYGEQKENVLKWPSELPDLVTWMEDPANYKEKIPEDLIDEYLNHVKNEFPKMLEIVDARPYWDKEEGNTVGLGAAGRRRTAESREQRGRAPIETKEYKVIWDKKNQAAIDDSLEFPKGRPDSTQVRFCQENLWVYNALLKAIARVNDGATGNHNAKIKVIIALSAGQDASAILKESLMPGKIMLPDGTTNTQTGLSTTASVEGAPAPVPTRQMESEGGGPPGSFGTADGLGKSLDDKRYLDDKGIPIPGGTEGHAEFKRMPIVMRLFMDQREIAQLLVTLANLPLPVEIRQLRINTKMEGFSNPRLVLFGGEHASGGGLGGRSGPEVRKKDKTFEEATQTPYDVAVELHGIIYIFNPPNPELLREVLAEERAAIEAQGGGAAEEAAATESPKKDATAPVGKVDPNTADDPTVKPEELTEPNNNENEKPTPSTKSAEEEPVAKEAAEGTGEFEQDAAPDKESAKKPTLKPERDAPIQEDR